MKTVERPDGSKVLEIPIFHSQEGEAALEELKRQIAVRFRCVEGEPRAYTDQGRLSIETVQGTRVWWPRVIYHVYAFGAEQEVASCDWGPHLVSAMQYVFEEFFSLGARIVVWRRGLELAWDAGGQRGPNLQRIYCRCAFLDNDTNQIDPGEVAFQLKGAEGYPPPMLTPEVLEDCFRGRPPTITPT